MDDVDTNLTGILDFVQTDVDGSAYRRRRGLHSLGSVGSLPLSQSSAG